MPVSKSNKERNSTHLSYWELNEYFSCFDLIVIGSGIVGLNAAFSFKNKHPKSSVLVVESGLLPSGASTKNAGFACFGSPSELMADLKTTNESVVFDTLKMRWEGLQILRKNIGDKNMDYKCWGGYELFKDKKSYEICYENINYLNKKIAQNIGQNNSFNVANKKIKEFGFERLNGMFYSKYEGQIDTGKMMNALLKITRKAGVEILNGIRIKKISDTGDGVELESELGIFKSKKVIVAVNGFAKNLLNIKEVYPARAQVLITKPIKNLKLKGTFHYQEGFYYFRNVGERVLFGGGRNLDIKGETTAEIAVTKKIQNHLEHLLKTVILPNQKFEVEHRWAGIMGVGSEKKPIIKHYTKNIICAVRMGGMGVAIGSLVGKQAAEMAGQ